MSSDYYSAVYTWFEQCGIISNIRTQLRQNLVNALKGNDLACKIEVPNPKSAKQYVYDLLIAEYLWNHDYTYTLSVFASEAPLLVNFHKHAPGSPSRTETSSRHKLQNDYICHTLETLGIKPCEPEGQHIMSEYAGSDTALLLCILKCIASLPLSAHHRESSNEKKTMQSRRTQTDYVVFENVDESNKLLETKRRLLEQKELFDAQLKKRENQLREQALLVERELASLNQKLEHAQNLMVLVNSKEQLLMEEKRKDAELFSRKEMDQLVRENLLSQEADRLQKERDSYRKFEADLKKLQEELNKVKKQLPNDGSNSSIVKRDVYVQTDLDSRMTEREDMKLLNQEKQELSSLIREQQSRIEELTLRAVHLSRQLEEAHLLRSPIAEAPENLGTIRHTNTVISESSSTEDILHDAKMRLRRLEEESLKADQYYYNCITTSPQ